MDERCTVLTVHLPRGVMSTLSRAISAVSTLCVSVTVYVCVVNGSRLRVFGRAGSREVSVRGSDACALCRPPNAMCTGTSILVLGLVSVLLVVRFETMGLRVLAAFAFKRPARARARATCPLLARYLVVPVGTETPTAMFASLLTTLATTTSVENVAILGPIFGTEFPSIDAFQRKLTTKWRLVSSTNATDADIATATAFVEAPFDILPRAKNGKLFQFSFTGIENELSQVPPKFTVSNCHQSSTPIAEYVLAAVLEWRVQLRLMDSKLRECTWKTAPPGNDCRATGAHILHKQISNATIGILGYGHIGTAIATRAAAFGTRVIATTVDPPKVPPAPLAWIGDDSMNPRLFAESDFVVVCVPLLNSTRGLVDSNLLSQLPKSGVLINIARGPVVDEDALYAALTAGTIGGAVLDVWWHDVYDMKPGGVGPDNWPSKYRFDQLGDHVIMSDHTSGITAEAHLESLTEAAANLDNLALGRPLQNVVRNGTAL